MFYDSKHVQFYTSLPGARARSQPRSGCGRARVTSMAEQRVLHPPARRAPAAAALAWALVFALTGPGLAQAGGTALAHSAPFAGPADAAPLAAAQAAVQASAAGQPVSLERKVKAAFLYKFLGYTEFPASAFSDPAAPVVIGVVAADELSGELSRIVAGRTVQGRPIAVRNLREGDAAAGVHLLFVGGNDIARLRAVLKAARPAPVLTVTEAEHGLQQGAIINFKVVEERVRFDVSLEAADKNSVKLSSRLLTVASHVYKGAP